ncbi:unnamed protein product [Trichobilharzia szidati]|nr:unnamed protein product [Trichobilharzia szidati]
MEAVAAHKDEVTPVESKIDDLKRKSVDAKDIDHDTKNGSDEPVVKKVRKDGNEAGDNASDEKVTSPTSEKQADDDASQDTKETNGTSEHLNGSNGEHVSEHQEEKSNDGTEADSEKGDDASADKESNNQASD